MFARSPEQNFRFQLQKKWELLLIALPSARLFNNITISQNKIQKNSANIAK